MSIQITQTGGAGAAVADKGLSGAWLDVPITVTLSNTGANAYEHAIEDQTTGLEIAIATGDARIATFTPSGNRGSFRIRSGYREQSYSPWRYAYRVIRVERDSTGANYQAAPPTLEETPSETAEDRGYAEKVDELFAGANSVVSIGAAPTEIDYDPELTIGGSTFDEYAGEDVAGVVLDGPHVEGAKHLRIVRGTATGVAAPVGLIRGDAYVVGQDYLILLEVVGGEVVASAVSIPTPDVAAPTVEEAVINLAAPTSLIVTYAEPVHVKGTPTLTGTALEIASYVGDLTEEVTYTLDGSITGSETLAIVHALGDVVDMSGNPIAAGPTSIDIGASFTMTNMRFWFRGDTMTPSLFPDESGSGRSISQATGTNQPIVDDVFGFPAADFVTNDKLENTAITAIADASFTIVALCQIDTPAGSARGTIIEMLATAGATFSGIMAWVESNAMWVSRGGVNSSFAYTSTDPVEFRLEFVDSTNELSLYVDDVLHSSYSTAFVLPTFTQLRVGMFGAASYPLDGKIWSLWGAGAIMTAPEKADWALYKSLTWPGLFG